MFKRETCCFLINVNEVLYVFALIHQHISYLVLSIYKLKFAITVSPTLITGEDDPMLIQQSLPPTVTFVCVENGIRDLRTNV